jgi:peptide/nickel transport system permease protein
MRLTELFQTIPNFLLAVVLVALFKASIVTTVFAISAVSWPAIARLVRGQFLSLREREFVQSCVVVGMSEARIIVTQILPNCLAPIVVMASIMIASAILTESGLSFLGLGDPDLMSWGAMIGIGREALRTAWYMVTLPGLAILVTVLALNLVGEGLNDALNPHLKNR